MVSAPANEDRTPIGHLWLREHFGVRAPRPYVCSYVAPGSRRTEIHGPETIEYYGRSYLPDPDQLRTHLRFALRHEPLDLRVFVGALKAMGPEPIHRWVLDEPTGTFSRRAWFLYETFVGMIDVGDVKSGNYVDMLDKRRHVTAARVNSPRHRVADNMLGGAAFCPTVRKTPRLVEQLGLHVDVEAKALIASYDPATLARAISYLYTRETKSSFAIEGENPSPTRTSRFVAALRSADRFDPGSQAAIVSLQNQIVDPRYAAKGWRDFQNFVGENVDFREQVHFICPRPRDVPDMMAGWSKLVERMAPATDPIVAAAVAAFAFVFVHPFEDGNGRIHRYVMHHILARTGFSPPGVIFPVSAAIARDQKAYDDVLGSFSSRLFKHIDWHWIAGASATEREILVDNDTADLYRYFDATLFAEYLHDRVAETVHTDLRKELNYVAIFDRAFEAIREIVDMPDRRASLFIRLCLQNAGRLSGAKREQFTELTDAEIVAMEHAVGDAIFGELHPIDGPDLFSRM
ncbi:Fic family protein [Sphingomonas sp. 1P08PE]|uniref:Fic family protein n=1 Tax=Sphingomonas sp. 1P08PE TaxID=554122 RepID=UPI00399F89F0